MLRLALTALPNTLRGPTDEAYKGMVPSRARFLAPDAALSLGDLTQATGNALTYTDVFRSAEASLAARASKRGVQRPAYSGHNFGLSFDLDLDASMRGLHCSYAQMTDILNNHGWFCHRRDLDPNQSEAWHFNYLGDNSAEYLELVDPQNHATWSKPIESRIIERYGAAFILSPLEVQAALAKLGMYSGALDGLIGPVSREAIQAFQRAWMLDEGPAGPVTQRTLSYVACERVLVMPTGPMV